MSEADEIEKYTEPRAWPSISSSEPRALIRSQTASGLPRMVINIVRRLVRDYKAEHKMNWPVEIWQPDRKARSGEIMTAAGLSIEFDRTEEAWVLFVNLRPLDSRDRVCIYVLIDDQGEHICSIDARTRPGGRSGIRFRRDEEFWAEQGGSPPA